MRADTALIHHDKRAIQYIQMAFFDKQNGEALLDGDGLEWWKKVGHIQGIQPGRSNRAISSIG